MRSLAPFAVLLAAAIVVGGCGSDEEAPERPIRLVQPPTPPGADDCASPSLATRQRPDELAPEAGTYRYETDGILSTLRDGRVTDRRQLPGTTPVIVTEARRVDALRCFRVQRRLTDSLADTATVVIVGSDVYIARLELQAGGDLIEVVPRPPIRSLAADELEWAGSFAGPTRGVYEASILGRRTMRVGGARVRAVGIEIRLSYAGDVRGRERSRAWFSLRENLALTEQVERERDFGLERQRLDYRSKLVSLTPGKAR
jgi:hypothetical protein